MKSKQCYCGKRKDLEWIAVVAFIPWFVSWIGIFFQPYFYFIIWIVSFGLMKFFGHADYQDTMTF